MSSDLKDPQYATAKTCTTSYTTKYSEKVRLALTVLAGLNKDELGILQTALAERSKGTAKYFLTTDVTTMVHTGPLYEQCPYCGRS